MEAEWKMKVASAKVPVAYLSQASDFPTWQVSLRRVVSMYGMANNLLFTLPLGEAVQVPVRAQRASREPLLDEGDALEPLFEEFAPSSPTPTDATTTTTTTTTTSSSSTTTSTTTTSSRTSAGALAATQASQAYTSSTATAAKGVSASISTSPRRKRHVCSVAQRTSR